MRVLVELAQGMPHRKRAIYFYFFMLDILKTLTCVSASATTTYNGRAAGPP